MYATRVFPSLHLNEASNEMNERIKRPNINYYPKASTSWLTVKEQYFKIFEGTTVKITVKGIRHLGAIVGSKEYKRQCFRNCTKLNTRN